VKWEEGHLAMEPAHEEAIHLKELQATEHVEL
jgi:hypothetical protein